MSNQQWELVTKTKKEKSSNGTARKLTKTEKKKFAENAPKVEDLLPLSMVKTLYSEFSDIKKPTVDVKAKGKENDARKQPQKKQPLQLQQSKGEKPKEKDSKPKTLDAAIQRIDVLEFQNMVTLVQSKFDRSPLLWLRTIDNYLDSALNIEISDPVFSSKNHEYPQCLLPSALRSVLEGALKEAGEASLQNYFELLLMNLATEMTKGSHAVGTRLLLQLIAASYPKIAVAAIPKCLSLQPSYKSRKAIWLSVLWAMGQAGFRDLSIGLIVWQEVMLPIIDMRNYSQFVVEYLTRLLGRHAAGPALSVNDYLTAFDSILRTNAQVSSLTTDSLHRQAGVLRKIAVNATPDAKLNLFFKPLIDRLSVADTDAYKAEILEFLYLCISEDEQCFSTWKQLYSSKIPESAALLQHLGSKWNLSESKLSKKSCKSFLDYAIKTNASLQNSKPKVKGLEDCCHICQSLTDKMAVKKKSSSYWKFIRFFIILALGGIVAYDIKVHGSFKASTVGRTLHDTGALAYGNLVLEQAKVFTQRGAAWTRENGPVYYASAVEVSKPYLQLTQDIGIIAFNGISKTWIAFDSWCTKTAPEFTTQVKDYAAIAGEATVKYASDFARYTKVGFNSAQDYAAKNIFVGKWSPENLQKMTHEAVNVTQQYVISTYTWIVEQVDSVNKAR